MRTYRTQWKSPLDTCPVQQTTTTRVPCRSRRTTRSAAFSSPWPGKPSALSSRGPAGPAPRCLRRPITRSRAGLSASPILGGVDAQVTPIFDLRQHRCQIARYMPGTPQVHGRSIKGPRRRRDPARRQPDAPGAPGRERCIADQGDRRTVRRSADLRSEPQGDNNSAIPPRDPGPTRKGHTARWILWAIRGPERGSQ